MNKLTILLAFANRSTITMGGVTGEVQSIEHEDGSGNAWNITFVGAHAFRLFVRFDAAGKVMGYRTLRGK